MVNKEEHILLFELGCADLKLVEKNLDEIEVNRKILLFHLQQAVEKFLKSLLSFNGVRFPKVHDIEILIQLCEENKIILPEYIEDFVNLTPYAVEFRYGVIIEEDLDLLLYYRKVSDFKPFVEKKIHP